MRTLALDLGNSTLFVGVFTGERLSRCFRLPSTSSTRTLVQELVARVGRKVDAIALCSVVPQRTDSLVAAVHRAYGIGPHILTADAAHGLTIDYRDPRQLGTDRLAAVLGAHKLHPPKHVVVVDCGTATTLTFLRRDGVLLGGAIMPGLGLWPEALARRTARLPEIELRLSSLVVARDTVNALRSGILRGHAGAIRELVSEGSREAFGRARPVIIGTGGLVTHFKRDRLFTATEPGLILHGLQFFASRQTTHA